MSATSPLLEAIPPDPTLDAGPVHRGGLFTYFALLSCGLTGIGGGFLIHQRGHLALGLLCLAVMGALALRAGWCVADRLWHHRSLPRAHAVLTDVLGFRIQCTCRDVAVTAFTLPDSIPAQASTRLLVFLENYASRQRVAELRIGPHRELGLPTVHHVSLRLAPGQATVYVVPLVATPSLVADDHDVPLTLKVRKPNGTGVRLPGVRQHLYDLWTLHFAVPLTVTPATGPAPAPLPPPAHQFLTLASVSDPEPNLAVLDELIRSEPAR